MIKKGYIFLGSPEGSPTRNFMALMDYNEECLMYSLRSWLGNKWSELNSALIGTIPPEERS